VNEVEWNYVNTNYSTLMPSKSEPTPPHFNLPITLPTGTVEVKAAWKPLSSIPIKSGTLTNMRNLDQCGRFPLYASKNDGRGGNLQLSL
jgi:hypothetical protein